MLKNTFFALLLMTTLVSAQALEMKVFQLNNRPAESAVEMVRPLLSPGATVVPDERTNKLIVRDTPEVLAQVEKLLQQIDVAAPQVMIKVNFTGQNPGSSSQAGVGYRSNPDTYGVRAGQTDTYSSTSGEQKLMVMSGEQGRIVVGRQLTYIQPYYGFLPPGLVVQNITTGFVVRPKVSGEYVTVELIPWMSYDSAQGPGQVLYSEGATTVRVHSGDSVAVAGGSQSQSRSGGGVAAGARGSGGNLDAWGAILGRSADSQTLSSSLVLTPTIIPDWSK